MFTKRLFMLLYLNFDKKTNCTYVLNLIGIISYQKL